ncbi:MAG: DNA polymerase/3'-5' exonuclease PolX [Salinigranum sp.]
MSRNEEVATVLEEYADLIEAAEGGYKPQSYREAAENVRQFPKPVEQLAAESPEEPAEINAVGDSIARKITEYLRTGEIEEMETLREEYPIDMPALTSVEGIGPKTAGKLYRKLGITNLEELETAAEEGKIHEVSGFGEKSEQNILDHVAFAKQSQERVLLGEARPLAERILGHLTALDSVEKAEIAGSIRRWLPTIGDVDLLAAGSDGTEIVDQFSTRDAVEEVIEAGPTKASVRIDGVRIDLRVVPPEEFGAALQYFTGSKAHNIHVRNIAISRGLKMNEYGVFDVSDVDEEEDSQRAGRRIGGATEAEMYDAVGLPTFPPEIREDTGEIEAAREGSLPDLLVESDIRGDLHTHTDWSDGNYSIQEMVVAAAERGYDYHCIADHAAGPGIVGGVGLTDEDLREQHAEIEDLRERAPITVFHGVEANIDAEGNIDVGEDVLKELDVVVASPHSALDQDAERGTERIVRAIEHPDVDVIGHPTGRLINRRPGLDLDVDRVVEAAVEHDTALEVNAHPHRLDLDGDGVRTAVEAGATIVIDTDAHGPGEFDLMHYGVHTARRGWAEKTDVLNTLDADGVRAFVR